MSHRKSVTPFDFLAFIVIAVVFYSGSFYFFFWRHHPTEITVDKVADFGKSLAKMLLTPPVRHHGRHLVTVPESDPEPAIGEFLPCMHIAGPVSGNAGRKRAGKGKPVSCRHVVIQGIPLYLTTVDMRDPDVYIATVLPRGAALANSTTYGRGDEDFAACVKDAHAAVLVNGTFFSKDAQKRVMGNVISGGKTLKYSRWENYGTTCGLGPDNRLSLSTTRGEGKPDYLHQWWSLTCGPRLLKGGNVVVDARREGFADPHVLGAGPRVALGLDSSGTRLYIATFLRGLSLSEEAGLMKAIGCNEAMNLDGGASRALAQNGKILVSPSRPLTNCIAIYDCNHHAPANLIDGFDRFMTFAASPQDQSK